LCTKLTQDSLVNVEEALTKANEFEHKANVYRFVAKNYRQYADDAIAGEFGYLNENIGRIGFEC
jgi:hypothetical protein